MFMSIIQIWWIIIIPICSPVSEKCPAAPLGTLVNKMLDLSIVFWKRRNQRVPIDHPKSKQFPIKINPSPIPRIHRIRPVWWVP